MEDSTCEPVTPFGTANATVQTIGRFNTSITPILVESRGNRVGSEITISKDMHTHEHLQANELRQCFLSDEGEDSEMPPLSLVCPFQC